MSPHSRRAPGAALALALTGALLAACGSDTEPASPADTASADTGADTGDTLVIYSGRNEELIGDLLVDLEEAVDVPVEVRYAGTAELAAQLVEEGEASPADLFFGQDAGALGALSDAGLLTELPEDVRELADDDYQASDGTWVGTSARARVLIYDTEQVEEDALPEGIDELLGADYRGQVGYAPTNASWYSFVTGLRVSRGEDGAREWLEAFAANDPVAYEGNSAIVDAVNAGDQRFGLVNHYYYYAKGLEEGFDGLTAANHYFDGDDEGALVNVAGAGILASGDNQEAAADALRFLLSDTAQQYFADETGEYPVVEGISSTIGVPPLDELDALDIDLAQLDSLQETQQLLTEVGLGS